VLGEGFWRTRVGIVANEDELAGHGSFNWVVLVLDGSFASKKPICRCRLVSSGPLGRLGSNFGARH
jgi:hypothetical protein